MDMDVQRVIKSSSEMVHLIKEKEMAETEVEKQARFRKLVEHFVAQANMENNNWRPIDEVLGEVKEQLIKDGVVSEDKKGS